MILWNDNNFTIKWHEKDGNVFQITSRDILGKVGNISEKLDPRKSSINTITLDFEVDNPGDHFAKFLYTKLSTKGKMFFREVVELYKGEQILYKGFVRSISLKNAMETSYKIQLENVIGKLKTSLWDREFSEYLAESVEDINRTRLAPGFVMEERIKNPDDPPEKHELYRVITYTGHIFDCYKGMLQMALSKPEIQVNVIFLDNNYLDFIDLTNFNEMKKEFDSMIYTVYFEFIEPIENIFEFFQTQIFQAVGVAPVVTSSGRLKTIVHQQPTITEGIKLFGKDNTIKYSSKNIDESQVVNNLKIDYMKIEDEYLKAILKINSASYEFFGNELIPEKPQEVKVDSINKHSRADQVTFCSNIADRLFSRYSREINVLDITVPIQEGCGVELGEFVNIESDILIDWENGERGLLEKIVESGDPVAKFNVKDYWGGFIEGNTLGIGTDGQTVVTTTDPEIKLEIFRGMGIPNVKSFLENHIEVKGWVDKEIG